MTVELSMLAPVVVMAETTTNSASMETMSDVKYINIEAMAIKEINTFSIIILDFCVDKYKILWYNRCVI